jgi:predicted enzyme related to lactoylglutathione lyase
MPDMPKYGAVVFVKELGRAAKFYSQLLSLSVTRSEADHAILESAHFELVIHAIPRQIANSIVLTTPPTIREDTAIKLIFPVASIADARTIAEQCGGQLNPSQSEWNGKGFRACDGHDPEGNVFQLRQYVS